MADPRCRWAAEEPVAGEAAAEPPGRERCRLAEHCSRVTERYMTT